jgi:hypothetical protein
MSWVSTTRTAGMPSNAALRGRTRRGRRRPARCGRRPRAPGPRRAPRVHIRAEPPLASLPQACGATDAAAEPTTATPRSRAARASAHAGHVHRPVAGGRAAKPRSSRVRRGTRASGGSAPDCPRWRAGRACSSTSRILGFRRLAEPDDPPAARRVRRWIRARERAKATVVESRAAMDPTRPRVCRGRRTARAAHARPPDACWQRPRGAPRRTSCRSSCRRSGGRPRRPAATCDDVLRQTHERVNRSSSILTRPTAPDGSSNPSAAAMLACASSRGRTRHADAVECGPTRRGANSLRRFFRQCRRAGPARADDQRPPGGAEPGSARVLVGPVGRGVARARLDAPRTRRRLFLPATPRRFPPRLCARTARLGDRRSRTRPRGGAGSADAGSPRRGCANALLL